MLLSAVSVLVVAQSSSEIPEGLMNNPVFSAAKHVYSLLKVILFVVLLPAILYFHCCCFIKYLKPALLLLSAEFVMVCLEWGKASH